LLQSGRYGAIAKKKAPLQRGVACFVARLIDEGWQITRRVPDQD